MSENEDASAILEYYKKIVWEEVSKYFKNPKYPKYFEIPDAYSKEVEFHWKIAEDYPSRQGKYIRPTILILMAEALGANIKNVIKTASAMQISEDWILIHDDLEDHSVKRRGLDTLHLIYGDGLAINAGDTLHALMWHVLANNFNFLTSKKSLEIMNEFHSIMMRTTLGQGVEINWARTGKLEISEDDYFFVVDSKSGYYSIAGPLRLGAILGNATPNQLVDISEFGLYMGRCFQLVDDLLDVTSDFSNLKQKGNDIYEGKRTLLISNLMKRSSRKEREQISNIITKDRENKTQDEVNWLIKMLNDKGSIEYAYNIAKLYKQKAEGVLTNKLTFVKKQPARKRLEILVNFILERKH